MAFMINLHVCLKCTLALALNYFKNKLAWHSLILQDFGMRVTWLIAVVLLGIIPLHETAEVSKNKIYLSRLRPRLIYTSLNFETDTETFYLHSQNSILSLRLLLIDLMV